MMIKESLLRNAAQATHSSVMFSSPSFIIGRLMWTLDKTRVRPVNLGLGHDVTR